MKNFEFEHDGKKLWYSRSLACGLIVFAYNTQGELCVLANKRGSTLEYNPGLWNVPGGFIDFDENALECAIRETYEETGIDIEQFGVLSTSFLDLDTTPHGGRQTMTVRYVAFLSALVENIEPHFSTDHSEPGEVDEIKFIPFDDINQYKWSRCQIEYINMAYSHAFIPF